MSAVLQEKCLEQHTPKNSRKVRDSLVSIDLQKYLHINYSVSTEEASSSKKKAKKSRPTRKKPSERNRSHHEKRGGILPSNLKKQMNSIFFTFGATEENNELRGYSEKPLPKIPPLNRPPESTLFKWMSLFNLGRKRDSDEKNTEPTDSPDTFTSMLVLHALEDASHYNMVTKDRLNDFYQERTLQKEKIQSLSEILTYETNFRENAHNLMSQCGNNRKLLRQISEQLNQSEFKIFKVTGELWEAIQVLNSLEIHLLRHTGRTLANALLSISQYSKGQTDDQSSAISSDGSSERIDSQEGLASTSSSSNTCSMGPVLSQVAPETSPNISMVNADCTCKQKEMTKFAHPRNSAKPRNINPLHQSISAQPPPEISPPAAAVTRVITNQVMTESKLEAQLNFTLHKLQETSEQIVDIHHVLRKLFAELPVFISNDFNMEKNYLLNLYTFDKFVIRVFELMNEYYRLVNEPPSF
ncbi:hypothetical protein K7432_008409 [Basidiobolus ranarum]|uniref:Up-regulated during septation protein 1 domain-containing protein n=1 Tax=Basidiobolus ranarum TaxID=34480 RepID=A0ABR2VYU1_9FUNG